MKIAVLLTCHNRVGLTRHCLSRLAGQVHYRPEHVFLVDDGSTDGTGEVVRREFPGVNVVEGDGSLFWNGGMRLAWDAAKSSGIDFDHYAWLNDDVDLYPDTFEMMLADLASLGLEGKPVLIGAATVWDEHPEVITYGGQIRPDPERRPLRLALVKPDGKPQRVDALSGNIVLVSRQAERVLGNLSSKYVHIFGDNDYALRAARHGIPVYLASGVGGSCLANLSDGSALDMSLSRWERCRLMWKARKSVHARDMRKFAALHGGYGAIGALAYEIAPFLRVIAGRNNLHALPLGLEQVDV